MSELNWYFEQRGDAFHPTDLARGTWDPRIMHGRYIGGLVTHTALTRFGDPAFQVARLTTDLFRTLLRQPVRVEADLRRDGNRVRVVDTSIVLADDGTEIARGTVLMLRRSAPPEGEVWAPVLEPMPHPDTLPQPPPHEDALTHSWSARPAPGAPRGRGPDRVWYREPRQLVEGLPLLPAVRLALAADLTNVSANGGTAGLNYINADVVAHLVRDPEGEWIGLQAVAHHEDAGIAVGECVVHDLRGPLGRISVCAIANHHRR